MKKRMLLILILLMAVLLVGCGNQGYRVGVGCVDITPYDGVDLTSDMSDQLVTTVEIPLYAKAVVFALGKEKAAVITLDSTCYSTEETELAMEAIGQQTGVPADRVMIISSHTHNGPRFEELEGALTAQIVEAVKLAEKDLEPCQLALASTEVANVAHNRRLIVKDEVWNAWMLPTSTRHLYATEGPVDTQLQVLAAIRKDGSYKTILWNYSCHANANNMILIESISSDYPGRLQEMVTEDLGYEVPTLFINGACGDVNPNNTVESTAYPLSKGVLECLENLTAIEVQALSFETSILDIPGRENPVLDTEDMQAKWPDRYEHYKASFETALAEAQDTYKTYISVLRLGDNFALVSNPAELFCQYGLDIKAGSPYEYTMVAELANGYVGYVPTVKSFEMKGYETWFRTSSYLSINAGEMIRDESIRMLNAGEEE